MFLYEKMLQKGRPRFSFFMKVSCVSYRFMPASQNVEHWLSLEDNEPTECDADWHASSAQVRPSKKEVQEVQRKQDDICDAEVALVEKERSTPQDGEAKADVADGIDNPVGLLYPVSI